MDRCPLAAKIDVLDLVIICLRDHEKRLDQIVHRLEGLKISKK